MICVFIISAHKIKVNKKQKIFSKKFQKYIDNYSLMRYIIIKEREVIK